MARKEKPVRRRRPWIWLIALAILAAGVFGLYKWQKNNIDAVILATQNSKEELETQLEENDLRFQQMLQDALANASTVEDLPPPAELLPEEPETPPETEAPVKKGPTYQELLQAIVDRAYALKNEYVGALQNMEAEARTAYHAIPGDQRTKKRLVEFASTYISKATNLEKDCDKRMDEVINDLEALQKQYGQSLDLVKQVINTYANEKSLKKAWYMAELESRGMV